MIGFQQQLNASLFETTRKMAAYAPVFIENESLPLTGTAFESIALSYLYCKNEVLGQIGEQKIIKAPVIDGSQGLNFLQSSIMEQNDVIDIVVSYRMAPKVPFFQFYSVSFFSRCRMHAWTGYEVPNTGQNQSAETIVYVCENGKVYHTERECSHLRLTISQVDIQTAIAAQNESGENYEPCNLCCHGDTERTVFITKQGNRYHNTLNCSGLKRTVYAIPFDKVGNLPLCERCAEEK